MSSATTTLESRLRAWAAERDREAADQARLLGEAVPSAEGLAKLARTQLLRDTAAALRRVWNLAARWASANENMLGVDAAEGVRIALAAPTSLDAMTPEARSAMFDREDAIADEAARRQAWGELQPNVRELLVVAIRLAQGRAANDGADSGAVES